MNRTFSTRAALLARTSLAATVTFTSTVVPAAPTFASEQTETPIEHVIIIVGENRTFDHLFATYEPRGGEHVRNLLARGIVTEQGEPGPNYARAKQRIASDTSRYTIAPTIVDHYESLPTPLTDGAPTAPSDSSPPPYATVAAVAKDQALLHSGLPPEDYVLLTTGATGLPSKSPDTRIADVTSLPNGPFQITDPMPYDAYAASPVHRFYQMWQQADCSVAYATARNPSGCRNDLFPWVEVSVGAGSNGKAQPADFTDATTGEGATAMGFYNMAKGDAAFTKLLADQYTISDNYHQPVMGGTGANSIVLGTGFPIFWSDGSGNPTVPPVTNIENPDPQPNTNNYYTQDGYSGGSLSNCSYPAQPGVDSVRDYLSALPWHPAPKCAPGAYYLLNNYNPGYFGDGSVNTTPFTLPPSKEPNIGDVMNAHGVSWRYYGAGWNNYVADPGSAAGSAYCNICNPFLYATSIMTDPAQRTTHLKDLTDFDTDVAGGQLPSVSYVKPDALLDGHPASSKWSLFEAFTSRIIDEVQANQELWKHTAILVTVDEGGGYYDSGYIQPLDFFGDGTRIPAIMVSPYSRGGRVSHSYADHASFLKFIERNWRLGPITPTSRDALPNPLASQSDPYVPVNSPAIGDLMDMFDFSRSVD